MSGVGATVHYNYQPADAAMLDKTRRIEAVCSKFGVPLVAAALQFPLGHPAVVTVIPGAKTPSEAESNVRMMNFPIPSSFWEELRALELLPAGISTPKGDLMGQPQTSRL